MIELDQLKALVLEGGWDDESKKQVESFEQQLSELAVKEKIADDPNIKPFVEYLEAKVKRCETLLRTDRRLSDLERHMLFATIEIAEQFTSMFTGKRREALETEIKQLLKDAQARNEV